MVDVSIIIPVYNVEDYVAECLESVKAQEVDCTVECLIVDDRGTDRSMEVVRKSLADYNGPIQFRMIEREKNGGLSAARNTGIREARGEYVYFLDSDDLITPDCISSLYKRVKEHPGVQVVTGDFQTFPTPDVHKPVSLQGKNFPEFSNDISWLRSIFLTTFPITAWNKLVSRSFIVDNNLLFKEGILHEDNHWQAVAYHYISSVAFVNKVSYFYRMRSGSITLSANSIEAKLKNLQTIYSDVIKREFVWDKNWDKWVYWLICHYKRPENYKECRNEAERTWRVITHTAARNRSCPILLRIMYCYMLLPKAMIHLRILNGLHSRFNSNLPEVGKPLGQKGA